MVWSIILLMLAFVAITMAIPPDDPHANKWKEFKEKHGKKYKDDQEEETRFKIFSDTQDKIDAHNKRFQEGKEKYQVAMQRFGDLTEEEFKKTHTGSRPPNSIPKTKREAELHLKVSLRDLPASVDWRNQTGYVSAVQDQGYCGSCWTFSATGAVEGLVARVIGSYRMNKAVDTSEQQLLDCVYPTDTCDVGGYYTDAWKYLRTATGSYYETSYPYIGQYGTCHNATGFAQKGLIRGHTCLPTGDENALQQAVATIGPVSVSIDASSGGLFPYYIGPGVYYSPTCSPTETDHAVLVVGYGTDANGDDYYIVKNSWGADMGINGYWLMARNKGNNCGIASFVCYPYYSL